MMQQEDEKNRNAVRDTGGKQSPSPGSTPSKAEGEESDVEEALERAEKPRPEQEKR